MRDHGVSSQRSNGRFETDGERAARRARATLRLDLQDAHDEGTMVGFFLGITATVLGWTILSGFLVQVCIAIVERVWLLSSLVGGGT